MEPVSTGSPVQWERANSFGAKMKGFNVESSNGSLGTSFISSRRHMLELLGAGAAMPFLASLAACSSGGGTAAATSGGGPAGKLTYVYNGNAQTAPAQKAQFEGFLKVNPAVDFVAQAIPAANWAGFSDAIATRIAGGAAPDVVDIATEGLALFRTKKLVKSLDPYIAKNKTVIDEYFADLDPMYKKISDQYGNPGGVTYFMPGGFNTVCTWANTDVFHQAGVDLPGDSDWTWVEYEAAAKKIKAATGAYIAFGDTGQFNGIMPWLLTNGASTMNADWTQPTIDSDAAIESAQWYAMMVAKGYFTKPGGTVDQPALVSQGKVASLWAGMWQNAEFRTLKMTDKLQVVKMPKNKMNGSPIGWDTYPILSSSQNPDTAWAFLEYLTTKANGIAFAEAAGNNIPARKSVAQSSVFTDNAPKGVQLLVDAVQYATAVPSPPRGDLTQNAIEQAWTQIATGAVQADVGLKQLNEQLAPLISQS